MQPSRLVGIFVLSAVFAAAPGSAFAQAADPQALRQEIDQLKADIETLRQQYSERLSALEARLASLEPGAACAAGAPAPAQPDTLPSPGAAAGASKMFNPDISVIGNFVGVAGKNPMSDEPPLSLTEVEAAFQAVVDPYARADFFLAAGPEGLEVEEGYITFTSLPAGLLVKAGKMRTQFGKANAMHTHILPWADRPLVSQNLFGGEEGVSDAGISVSRLIPNSLMFVDAIGEVYRGDSDVFHSESRSKLNYLGRIRGYRDLSEGTNIDLGVSYAHGPSAVVDGFSAQPHRCRRHVPLSSAQPRHLPTIRGPNGNHLEPRGPAHRDSSSTPSGFYTSADYQFARRWFAGARLDRSGRPLEDAVHDSGGSLSLTFRPSEFSLVRGQYRRTQYAEGIDANELLLQLNFSIGAHGAHPF